MVLYLQLKHWANHRHPRKSQSWIAKKHWLLEQGEGWKFAAIVNEATHYLAIHNATAIKRHIKVQNERSPFDADWVYWSTRMGKHPQVPARVALLLKRQRGICPLCRLFFKDGDLLEIDHRIPRSLGYRVYTSPPRANFQPIKVDSNCRNPLTNIGIPGGLWV